MISIVIVLVASTAARVAAMPDPDNSRDYKYFKVDFKDYVDIKDEGTTIVIDQNVYPTAAASNKKEVIEAAGDKKSEAFRVGDIKEINAIPDSTPIKNDEQSEEEEPEYEYYYVYEDYDEEYGDDQDYDYESGEDGGEAEVLPPVTEVSFREAPGPTPRVPVLEGVVIESIKKSNPFLKTSEGLKTLDNLADESEAVGNIEQDEGTAKTERSADHSHGGHHHQNSIFNPATITNGWVPSTFLQSTPKPLVSTGASTVFFQQGPPRPIEGTYIPVTTTTLPPPPPPPPPQPAVPAGINSYIPPNPVRTADIPTPPKPTLPPATSYGSPQIVFIQESNYVAPAPTPRPRPPKPTYQKPRPSYLKPRPQYHNTHHYARPAYRPYSTTRRPESPRNYFPAPDIPGVLEDEGASTLLDLLEQADLIRDLAGEGPFTLFAPTNEAFSKLDPNLVSTLTDDQDLLRSVLLYHVVPRKLFSRNFNDDVTLDTLLDEAGEQKKLRLTMNKENKIITVNGAEIIQDLMDQTAKVNKNHCFDLTRFHEFFSISEWDYSFR